MKVVPCRLCGYHAPGASCPHCRLKPREAALSVPVRGALRGVSIGLAALPRGAVYLAGTRGVKRWLLPPFVLTLFTFAFLFVWAWRALASLLERLNASGGIELGEGWWRSALEWIVNTGLLAWLAPLTSFAVLLVVGILVSLWTFSLVYEAFSGPFLDEVQGRIEKRWFGEDPRDTISRPADIASSRCWAISSIAALIAMACVLAWWLVDARWSWWLLAAIPLPFLVAARIDRPYGRWLAWVAKTEGATLWVSIKASLLAAVLLICFLPLKFVPFVGPLLFACVAGFATAISLLDIPFSRRGWPLSMRLAFMLRNLPAVVAFGLVSGLLFLVPIAGAVLMVPASSVGGLWLVCRLDKQRLRGNARSQTQVQAAGTRG
jgi:uncharacterized protein involved in cysteine biosynthesis